MRSRTLPIALAVGTALLGLASCAAQPAPTTSPKPRTTQTATATQAETAARMTRIANAQIEESCDELAAKRFSRWHGTDPVFVNPSFSAGSHGQTLVQQKVPYTDESGTPQTSLLECAGTFHASDNSVTAKLIFLTKHS